jgi:CBS domain-containing protein
VGILTDRDIRLAGASTAPSLAAHEWVHLLEKMTVNAIMTTEVRTVRRDTAVADAGQLFLDHPFSCLPVVGDDDMLEGIITVTDLLRAYVAQHAGTASPST